jgi:hypothetical protein
MMHVCPAKTRPLSMLSSLLLQDSKQTGAGSPDTQTAALAQLHVLPQQLSTACWMHGLLAQNQQHRQLAAAMDEPSAHGHPPCTPPQPSAPCPWGTTSTLTVASAAGPCALSPV